MFEIDGLDEWIAKLERIKVEFTEEIEAEILKLANKLLRKVKQRTPVGDTGELRRNWEIGDIVREDNGWYIEVFNKDRKSTRLNSSHANISYAVFCLKKKNLLGAPVSLVHLVHSRPALCPDIHP